MFKRGDAVLWSDDNIRAVVLGPDDFEGYEQNDPNKYAQGWELVEFRNAERAGERGWVRRADLTRGGDAIRSD